MKNTFFINDKNLGFNLIKILYILVAILLDVQQYLMHRKQEAMPQKHPTKLPYKSDSTGNGPTIAKFGRLVPSSVGRVLGSHYGKINHPHNIVSR